MREIKFRGKDKAGNWHYGGYVDYLGKPRIVNEVNDGPLYALATEQVIPETLGQYTGLKDKNGVEVYEGDILFRNNAQFPMRGPVEYESGGFYFHDEELGFCQYPLRDIAKRGTLNDWELVGNIHDTKEAV